MSFICHIHNYTEYNEEWNVFSAFNPSKCTHCAAPGEQSWTSCRSRDSNPQPWVISGFKSNALSIRPTTARDWHLRCFISVYFNVNDELEAAACHFSSLNDVGIVCSMCVWYPCTYAVCMCVCLRAISGGKSEKVWAHVTKLSYTSIRCNICSSVIVNKGGNTSNIIKHLLTKHNMRCAVWLSGSYTHETLHLFTITKVHYLHVL